MNARLDYRSRNSKKQQFDFQYHGRVLKKFTPVWKGVDREMLRLPFLHLARLYKLLKVAFVPLEPFFRVFKKFAHLHRGANLRPLTFVCFDSCTVQPLAMYWINLPKVRLFCLGHFFMEYFYFNTPELSKNSEKENLNERTDGDNLSNPIYLTN